MFKLTPAQINAEMAEGTAFKQKGSDIFIAVKVKIDPSWEKIGQLER